MIEFFVDILDEIDDIIISSLLLSLLYSLTLIGFDFGLFTNFFVFFLILISLKVVLLKIFAKAVFLDHVEFRVFEEKKVKTYGSGIKSWKHAIFFGFLNLLKRFTQLFSLAISILSFGYIKLPFYGKIQIKVSFEDSKGDKASDERFIIASFSILLDILLSLSIYFIYSDLSSIPIFIGVTSLFPYLSSEGTIIFTKSRAKWSILFSFLIYLLMVSIFVPLYYPLYASFVVILLFFSFIHPPKK